MNVRGSRRQVLGALVLMCGAGVPIEAAADSVYLTCNDNLSPMSLAIDYGTVTITSLTTGQASADVKGVTAQPAQITDSQIAWSLNGSTGQYSYVLSRLTGQLSWHSHDQVVGDDGGAMKCEVGAKPAPKF